MAWRLIVRGRVQGVGYRDWAMVEARRLGLSGWVRNRADGTVELLVDGDPSVVETFIGACWRGPPHAAVSQVDAVEASADGVAPSFERRPTV